MYCLPEVLCAGQIPGVIMRKLTQSFFLIFFSSSRHNCRGPPQPRQPRQAGLMADPVLALAEPDETLPGVPVDGLLADVLLDGDIEIPVDLQNDGLVIPEQGLHVEAEVEPPITPLRINLSARRVTPLRINLSQLPNPTVPPLRIHRRDLPQPQLVSPIRINRSRLQVVSPLRINRTCFQSSLLDSVEDSPTPEIQTGLEDGDVSIVHGDDTVEIIPGKYSLIRISSSPFKPLIF